MLSSVVDGLESAKVDRLAGTFRRRGRVGFLTAPQAGMPAIQAAPAAGAQGSWVSTVAVASLMALLLTLSAEVIAMVFGLWLLFRTSRSAVDAPAPAEA